MLDKNDVIVYKGTEISKHDVAILMEDKLTKQEALNYLYNGSIVYDSVEEYLESEKEWIADEIKRGHEPDDDEDYMKPDFYTEENIRAGKIENKRLVEYEGKKYVISYIT